ncbi:MAG: PEP-CTERM sorting domain-containing protein [Limnoraphis sp.]
MKKLFVGITTTAVLGLGIVGVAPVNAAQFVRENIKIDFGSTNGTNGQINQLENGYILTGDEWADYGLDISVDTNKNGTGNKNVNDSKRLTLYDTTKNGRDNDLRTGTQWGTEAYGGNALIIQETWEDQNWKTNNAGTHYLNPDDDAKGGTITFDFLSSDIDYIYEDLNIGLHDIDGPESAEITVYYTDNEGNQQQANESLKSANHETNPYITLLSKNEGDNSLWNFHFDVENSLKGLLSLDKIEVKYSGSGAVAYLEYDRFYKDSYGQSTEVPEPGTLVGLLALGSVVFGKKIIRKS